MTVHEFQITIEGRERALRRFNSTRTNEVIQIGGFWGLKKHESKNVYDALMGEDPFEDNEAADDELRRDLAPLIEISKRRAREAAAKRKAEEILGGNGNGR
jgi:hypothetical protein